MKILPRRSDFAMRATYRRGLARTVDSATTRENSAGSLRLGPGAIGATTCRPLPPVVFTKLASLSASSPSRMSRAHSRSSAHLTPAPGGRRHTTRAGWREPVHARVPRVDLEDADLDQPDERGERIDDQVFSDLPFLLDLDAPKTLRRPVTGVLLVEAGPVHTLGTAHEGSRSILEVRHDTVRDRLVETREIERGRAQLRVENPVGVRWPDAGRHTLL